MLSGVEGNRPLPDDRIEKRVFDELGCDMAVMNGANPEPGWPGSLREKHALAAWVERYDPWAGYEGDLVDAGAGSDEREPINSRGRRRAS